jgi:hypothetical protein
LCSGCLFIWSFLVPRHNSGSVIGRRGAIALTPNPELPLNARYFRLDHYVCATPEEFHRDDGAHLTILEWIRNANQAILFLSGVSGAGKSSVLAGYVLPMLEKDNIRIERIRSSARFLSSKGFWRHAGQRTADY